MFDHDALLQGLKEHVEKNKVFHRVGGKLNNQSISIDEWDKQMKDLTNKNTKQNYDRTGTKDDTDALDADAIARTQNVSQAEDPVIADEIPPSNYRAAA